mmetsp:Transcript_104571/g.335166  ORF Transcript_104571/g.335166 Transcript_104571/m.335166 type:complete len:84 (+) Transcript_104571:100-351(+)
MDAVYDVLDTKVNEKPFKDLKYCVASLTKGVVKVLTRARPMWSSWVGRRSNPPMEALFSSPADEAGDHLDEVMEFMDDLVSWG